MTKIDQNRAKLRGKVMPQMVPMPTPGFPETDWEATGLVSTSRMRADQETIKEGVNAPSMEAQLAARPEDAGKTANSPAFQASKSNVCSDMITGCAAGMYDAKTPVKSSGDLAAGGFSGGTDSTPRVSGL